MKQNNPKAICADLSVGFIKGGFPIKNCLKSGFYYNHQINFNALKTVFLNYVTDKVIGSPTN